MKNIFGKFANIFIGGLVMAIFLFGFYVVVTREGNYKTASYVLDNISNKNKYITEISSWDTHYSGNVAETHTIYKVGRDENHSKYVLVLSYNNRSSKTAFVVTDHDQFEAKSGKKRVNTNISLLYPWVRG